MKTWHLRWIAAAAFLIALSPSSSTAAPGVELGDRDGAGKPASSPPSRGAARMTPNAGQCIKFLSVFVPAHGGNYVVGVSFTFRDMNWDGAYTPGTDRLDVCVNCQDACGWGP